jgi:ElaA protein
MPDPTASEPPAPAAPPPPAPAWRCARYAELTLDELYALLQLRSLVFVVEQQCPFLDIDGDDDRAWHLLGWTAGAGGRPLLGAYARLFAPGVKYAEASIGRVVSHPEVRRGGAGRALMAEALRRLDAIAPGAPVRIGAQQYLERFYASFGFARAGDDYLEDGIVHLEMVRPAGA